MNCHLKDDSGVEIVSLRRNDARRGANIIYLVWHRGSRTIDVQIRSRIEYLIPL